MWTFIFLVVCTLLIIYNLRFRKKHNYPPGPQGLPFVGNLHQIGLQVHLTFQKWSQQYGNIFSVQFGSQRAVCIDDPKILREIFDDPVFSGRPQNEIFTCVSEGNYGVINSEGQDWETQRRFTLRHLRDFGFGKNYMENMMRDEVNEVISSLKKSEGQPISVNRRFVVAVLNAIWFIVSGKRIEKNQSELVHHMDSFLDGFRKVTESGVLFVPWIRHIAPEWSGFNAFKYTSMSLSNFFKKTVEEHKKTFLEGHVRDFIDSYLVEMKDTTDSTSSFYQEKGLKNLTATTGDIFQAGSETTSATLSWAILFLTSHPDTQKKLHQELDQRVGKCRLPTLHDRSRLPYTEAVIMEVLRMSSLVPLGVFHRALATKEFQGYLIPKGTWIISNLYAIHHSKKIWGDPQYFRPERFLSDDEKRVLKHDALLPFQIGRRVCLGESFARDTIFIFLASIFQRFSVHCDPKNPKLDLEPENGFLLVPKHFNVVFRDRLE